MTKITESTIDNAAREILQKIDEAWPSPIVLRKDIAKFSCGLVTIKALAAFDCRGIGIAYSKINGKVTYSKQDVIKWLSSRIKNQEQPEKTRGAPRRGKNDILLQK
jgi:hypothetical protein